MLQVLAPAAIKLGSELIDNLFESEKEKAEAKAKLMHLEQQGKLQTTQAQLSAIIFEAKSADKWTSRARPAFMYVVYIMILASIPMGVLFAINPQGAQALIQGAQLWLAAIPEAMWTLFGVGYLGYAGARSFDKSKALKNQR